MSDKLNLYKIKGVVSKMDMSAGNPVDGPRWSGKYNKIDVTLYVVAPSENLAEARFKDVCHDGENAPEITEVSKMDHFIGVVSLFD